MKKLLFITLLGILLTSCNTKIEKETRNLKSFDKVNIVGNVELYLESDTSHSIEIKANSEAKINKLITEVRNGELFIYPKKDCTYCETPKYSIYLNHTGISGLNLTGVIKLSSEDVMSQESLAITGNGIFNGGLEVSVDNLSVDLHGISNINISGDTDASDLKVTGIGMIRATNLKTESSKNDSVGIATIFN